MSKMHTSPIGNRWQPLLIIDIMKDARGPMTAQEIYDEIGNRGHRKFSPTMIGACFAEIRDDKGGEGYKMSDAIKFPDGYYKYWLTAAPGWCPRWKVTTDFRVVPAQSAASDILAREPRQRPVQIPCTENAVVGSVPRTDRTTSPAEPEELFCGNPECKKQVTGPLPWCDDACRKRWRELVLMQPKETAPQTTLF